MANDITVAILAGGLSRRMGTNKSFVSLAGKPLIQHVIERVSALRLPVMLITNTPEQYAHFDLPMYGDVYPQCGSLGGLYTPLHSSLTDYTLCVACDTPFLNVDLLRYTDVAHIQKWLS
jgi:molybdopterin-guanine dinucleotide biosynthesis protein A